jgi:tetratricopeptide (TPR) repeat protein
MAHTGPARLGVRAAVLAALVGAAVAGPPRLEPPELAFAEACAAYRAREYARSLDLFRSLAARTVHPAVLYNQGNAAFKTGRLGEAILAWEKARRLAPRDPDIAANLAVARTRVKDSLPDEDPDLVSRVVFGLLDRLAADELVAASSLVWWAGFALATLALFARPAWKPALAAVVLACALALVPLLALTGLDLHVAEGQVHGVVLSREVRVLSGPAPEELVRFSLHEGSRVRVLREWERWVQVALPGGENGWTLADGVGTI